ncbi:MAG TPA: hypothetical protein PK733_18835 [Clostridiales bacterium]|nr:hypothetical protein [Clostridiales bacterium]
MVSTRHGALGLKEDKRVKTVASAVFTLFYTVLSMLFLIRGNYVYILESAGIYSIYLVYFYTERKGKVFINGYVLILCFIMGMVHSFFGHYLMAYDTSVYFDKILHFYAIFSFTMASYSLMCNSSSFNNSSKKWILLTMVMYGTAIGAIHEIVEFSLDTFIGTQSQKGLLDTNLDLVADFLGALTAGIIVAYTKIIDYINIKYEDKND